MVLQERPINSILKTKTGAPTALKLDTTGTSVALQMKEHILFTKEWEQDFTVSNMVTQIQRELRADSLGTIVAVNKIYTKRIV